jgi:hypothetical protein
MRSSPGAPTQLRRMSRAVAGVRYAHGGRSTLEARRCPTPRVAPAVAAAPTRRQLGPATLAGVPSEPIATRGRGSDRGAGRGRSTAGRGGGAKGNRQPVSRGGGATTGAAAPGARAASAPPAGSVAGSSWSMESLVWSPVRPAPEVKQVRRASRRVACPGRQARPPRATCCSGTTHTTRRLPTRRAPSWTRGRPPLTTTTARSPSAPRRARSRMRRRHCGGARWRRSWPTCPSASRPWSAAAASSSSNAAHAAR